MDKHKLEQLLARYTQGKATPDEKEDLDKFFNSYWKKAKLWRDENGDRYDQIGKEILANIHSTAMLPRRRRTAFLWMKIAASVLIIFIAGYVGFWKFSKAKPSMIRYTTQNGYQQNFVLNDGSKVYLNAGSELIYPEKFSATHREVFLKGEAYFEVTKGKTPFIVNAGGTRTRVLGTSFNVRSTNNRTEVTLVEGRVQISLPDESKRKSVLLMPNDQAFYDHSSGEFLTRKTDASKFVAWKEGVIYFEATPLEDVAELLSRWYNVKISLSDAIRSCKISGKYDKENLINILQSLQFMENWNYTIEAGDSAVVISGKGC